MSPSPMRKNSKQPLACSRCLLQQSFQPAPLISYQSAVLPLRAHLVLVTADQTRNGQLISSARQIPFPDSFENSKCLLDSQLLPFLLYLVGLVGCCDFLVVLKFHQTAP